MIDLHCDLLGCVEDSQGVFGLDSPEIRCSVSQLIEGKIDLQTLAIWTETISGSAKRGENQVKLYKKLLAEECDRIGSISNYKKESGKTYCLLSIENASSLIEEDEPLEKAFERFLAYQAVEKILYVSLTWNDENRFGGGNSSTRVGLKEDGKRFLEFLDEKGLYIDLSHTSDQLAEEILQYIDNKQLKLVPIASHSNVRALQDMPRNLPDHLISEIIQRGGVIGMNLVKRFIGEKPQDIFKHIKHIYDLGGEDAICMGGDYYGGLEPTGEALKMFGKEPFFQEFSHAGTMQKFLLMLKEYLTESQLDKLIRNNAWQRIKAIL